MTKSIAKKSTTGSLPPAVPLAITPTFSPWTHTSDDSYIYQLSLVLATATVSFFLFRNTPLTFAVLCCHFSDFFFFFKYTPMEVVPPAGMLVQITDDVLHVG